MTNLQAILPESVFRYCTDTRISSAVDLLLSSKSPKIPDGLKWEELDDFYRACLAAQQTKVEYALALSRIWSESIAHHVVTWRALSIDQQAAESGFKLDVDEVWKTREFTRDFTNSGYYLQWQVELRPDSGIRASCILYKEDVEVRIALPKNAELIQDWTCSGWQPIDEASELNTDALVAFVGDCMASINAAICS